MPEYVAKCDMLGSQGRHYGDHNNCMGGCLPLVEHATNGKKAYREEMPKPRSRRLRYDDKIYIGLGSAF